MTLGKLIWAANGVTLIVVKMLVIPSSRNSSVLIVLIRLVLFKIVFSFFWVTTLRRLKYEARLYDFGEYYRKNRANSVTGAKSSDSAGSGKYALL